MARRPNGDQTRLSFDGLTDSVTNLVGTLILLVVLLAAISKRASSPAPAPVPSTTENVVVGEQNTDDLLRRSTLMLEQLRRDEQLLQRVEGEIDALHQQVERLTASSSQSSES